VLTGPDRRVIELSILICRREPVGSQDSAAPAPEVSRRSSLSGSGRCRGRRQAEIWTSMRTRCNGLRSTNLRGSSRRRAIGDRAAAARDCHPCLRKSDWHIGVWIIAKWPDYLELTGKIFAVKRYRLGRECKKYERQKRDHSTDNSPQQSLIPPSRGG
jgi:hypothetical protein